MTDETKKLFDAPWKVDKVDFKSDIFGVGSTILRIFDKTEELITTHIPDEKTANRLARLPELYDALMETVYYKCFECMGGLRHNIDMTREEIVKNGCPKKNKSNVCIYVKHIELLRKVRDGK